MNLSNLLRHLNPFNSLSRGHECNRWQKDRPRYGEMCSNKQNCSHCKNDL